MPLSFVTVAAPDLEWKVVRETVADCVRFACDPNGTVGARIYPHWIYEISPETMLGKVTSAMRVSAGSHAGKVHCWTVGISAANFEKGENGWPDMMGGRNRQWRWVLDLDVWGFFQDEGTKEDQQAAENEARLVSATLWRNAEVIQSGVAKITGVSPLEFSNVAPSPFSEGNRVIVAAGSMKVFVQEALAA